jgi:1D-myo-inositol-tetrakisphosphate 5-kinase/inositol-polyphosphate multikinase
VQSSQDGSLIIKPCLPAERDFYQLIAGGDERFASLRDWVPNFYGTLKLEGKVKEGEEAAEAVIGEAAAAVGAGGKRTAEDVVVGVQKTLEAAPEDAEKDTYSTVPRVTTPTPYSYLPRPSLHSPSSWRTYQPRS